MFPFSFSCLSPSNITHKYEFDRFIGRGHFGMVRLCYDRIHSIKYAVKIVDKHRILDRTRLAREVSILHSLGRHPHICYLVEVFEDESSIYLVQEYCAGGDLLKKIVEEGKWTQERAGKVLQQVGMAMKYLHEKGIIHRDIKPDNVMLVDNSDDSDVKLIDFGLAQLVEQGKFTNTMCGTWAYYAPEVVSQKPYDHRVDIWALGVLMFILLAGYHPFDIQGDSNKATVLQKILKCDFSFNDPVWNSVDSKGKNIISALLKVDPDERMTLDQFLAQDYICNGPAKMEYITDLSFKYSRLRKYRCIVEKTANLKLELNRLLRVLQLEFTRLFSRSIPLASMIPSRIKAILLNLPVDVVRFARAVRTNLLPIPFPPKLPDVDNDDLPSWLLSIPSSDVEIIATTINDWLEAEQEQEVDGKTSKLQRIYATEPEFGVNAKMRSPVNSPKPVPIESLVTEATVAQPAMESSSNIAFCVSKRRPTLQIFVDPNSNSEVVHGITSVLDVASNAFTLGTTRKNSFTSQLSMQQLAKN